MRRTAPVHPIGHNATPPHLLALPTHRQQPSPQRLYLCKQHHKQGQMFLDSFAETNVVSAPQSKLTHLLR